MTGVNVQPDQVSDKYYYDDLSEAFEESKANRLGRIFNSTVALALAYMVIHMVHQLATVVMAKIGNVTMLFSYYRISPQTTYDYSKRKVLAVFYGWSNFSFTAFIVRLYPI